MRLVIVVPDGMADRADDFDDGRTPLEIAATPEMDALASEGECGVAVTVPGRLESGHYLELDGSGRCTIYDGTGEPLAQVQPTGTIPRLEAGDNRVEYDSGVEGNPHPRAQVTVITRGEAMRF